MTTSKKLRTSALVLALAFVGGLAACGGDDAPAASGTEGTAGDPAEAGAPGDESTDGSGEGRAFDSTDDAVITAVTTATGADRAEWDGSTLRVIFDEGSAEEVTVRLNCTAIEAVIADDESAVMVFPDGEFRCDEPPG